MLEIPFPFASDYTVIVMSENTMQINMHMLETIDLQCAQYSQNNEVIKQNVI